jgi:hypothetical protein
VEPRLTNLIHSWRPFVTRNVRKLKLCVVLSESYTATDALPLILPACHQPLLPACVFITQDTVRHLRCLLFGKFVREPICSWWEVFVNRGSTVLQRCLNTPYRLAPCTAVHLAYHLILPYVSLKVKLFALFIHLWKLAILFLSRWSNDLSVLLLNGKIVSCFRPQRTNAINTSLRLCLDGRFAACEHCYLQMAALLYTTALHLVQLWWVNEGLKSWLHIPRIQSWTRFNILSSHVSTYNQTKVYGLNGCDFIHMTFNTYKQK